MSTQTTEMTNTITIQSVLRGIAELSDESIQKLAGYIDDLIEAEEEAEDIAYIDARKNEPTVPLSEILKDYEIQHGHPYRRV